MYVVRNMVLFDFNEREVKDFSNKFVKLLKQDDKFLRDVYVSKMLSYRKASIMQSRKKRKTSPRKWPISSFRTS